MAKIKWANPTAREDGTPYGQNDNAGYEITIDGTPAVAIPTAWATEFELNTLDIVQGLKHGNHTAALAVVDKGGLKSGNSNAVTFPKSSKPGAPTGLALA